MSDPLNNTIQFVVNFIVFTAGKVGTEATSRFIKYLSTYFTRDTIINNNNNRELDLYNYKMFKWEEFSNAGSEISSSNSAKSVGDKWKSIIGRVNNEPMLDDEDVPEEEFYASSPESSKFKSASSPESNKFKIPSSPETNNFKTLDDTLLEAEPKWRCVSDESFLRMEQMVMSPLKTPMKQMAMTPLKTPLKRITENEVEVSNLISFSPIVSKSVREDVETSTADNEYETCESGESRLTDARKTTMQSLSYVTCDSEESKSSENKFSWGNLHYNTMASHSDKNSDLNSSQNTVSTQNSDSVGQSRHSEAEADCSLKFNDTLEEMEHLLKYGMNYMVKNDDNKADKKEDCFEKYSQSKNDFNQLVSATSDASTSRGSSTISNQLPTHNVEKYRDFNEIDVASPIKKKSVKKVQKDTHVKENKFRLKSPRLLIPSTQPASSSSGATSSFFPKKTPTKPRRFFYDTPPKSTPKSTVTPSKATTPSHLHTPTNSTPKYTNIMSPVQYYIKNSPIVPKIQNVSPGINLWERQSHRAASKGRTVECPKENMVPLTEKAYQQPKAVKLIETDEQRLPNNFKVNLMVENLPKPVVIKHQRREGTTPLKENNCLTRQNTYTLTGMTRESFAHLDQVEGDVSVCIGKPAARTHTLK